MEFLESNFIKYSSPFYWQILKKTILYSFNNFYKKIHKQENLSLFVERKNEVRKPDKNSSLRRLEFMPRNLD
jgi:hypothetical protein